ncbi:MAG: YybS family protein [Desulfobacteraceae bacterium]|nr:YybS family protein [Desulfobacteraceae bacterium]MDH3875581.1 YybS family protein [Desulfobacteraceae bacterium]
MLQTISRDISKDIISGIAVTSLIFVISVYIPIIGFFCALFIPLPTLIYRSKLGRTPGTIIPVIAIIIMAVILGGISIDILFFFELLLLGFVLSELLELNLSIEKTILYACGSVIITGIICLLFYSNIAKKEIFTLVSEYVSKNLELTLSLYENMGMKQESIQMISTSLENIKYVFIRIIPALVVVSTLFISWINLLLSKSIFKNWNLFYPDFGSLKLWKAPELLVWIIIGCGILLLFSNKTFKILGLNGLLILITVYFFQGIAIVSFYFEKKKLPRLLRFFLYGLIALQQIVLLVVIGLGFFDMWLNFRKLEHSPGKPGK